MDKEQYLNALEDVCEYIIGTSMMIVSKGKGYKDAKRVDDTKDAPEAGSYPVIVGLKEKTTICGWCEETVPCPNLKTISRALGSSIWEGKCSDCGKKVVNPFLDKDYE